MCTQYFICNLNCHSHTHTLLKAKTHIYIYVCVNTYWIFYAYESYNSNKILCKGYPKVINGKHGRQFVINWKKIIANGTIPRHSMLLYFVARTIVFNVTLIRNPRLCTVSGNKLSGINYARTETPKWLLWDYTGQLNTSSICAWRLSHLQSKFYISFMLSFIPSKIAIYIYNTYTDLGRYKLLQNHSSRHFVRFFHIIWSSFSVDFVNDQPSMIVSIVIGWLIISLTLTQWSSPGDMGDATAILSSVIVDHIVDTITSTLSKTYQ